MGAGGRSAAWVVMLVGLVGCAPKATPAPAATSSVPTLDGTWWMTDGLRGDVQGRIDFDDGGMSFTPVGGSATSFSLHREGREWEAIGDRGLVVRLDPMSADQLVLYRSDGQVGIMWRATPLPTVLSGRWVLQGPGDGSVRDVMFLGGPAGEPATMRRDERAGKVWSVRRADGGWALVVQMGARDVRLEQLHRLPDGAWIVVDGDGPGRVMYRRGERPRWVGPPAE